MSLYSADLDNAFDAFDPDFSLERLLEGKCLESYNFSAQPANMFVEEVSAGPFLNDTPSSLVPQQQSSVVRSETDLDTNPHAQSNRLANVQEEEHNTYAATRPTLPAVRQSRRQLTPAVAERPTPSSGFDASELRSIHPQPRDALRRPRMPSVRETASEGNYMQNNPACLGYSTHAQHEVRPHAITQRGLGEPQGYMPLSGAVRLGRDETPAFPNAVPQSITRTEPLPFSRPHVDDMLSRADGRPVQSYQNDNSTS